jgi:glucose/arabinose dehydrogenase
MILQRPLGRIVGVAVLAALLGGCAEHARLTDRESIGPNPTLPEARRSWIPTLEIAPSRPWPEATAPRAANPLRVAAFARGLDHPRWLLVLPNGDVLVAETNGPERPDDLSGLRGWVARLVMRLAGAGSPSADRITLLRDADGDGIAEIRSTFLQGLHSPFGMALVGDDLYVANTDAVLRFKYHRGDVRIEGPGQEVAVLPAGPINHHWTKSLLASRDQRTLFVTVGSNSNVGENGMQAEEGRAAIWAIDLKTASKRPYATGLRNANGLAWAPGSDALWTVVNERDEMGSDLVPDYLTSVQQGGFYGWPSLYWGDRVDPRIEAPADLPRAVRPDYALGNHVAPLGLASSEGALLGHDYEEGMFIGEHGSWNRRPPSGYKVVFVPFRQGRPAGMPSDVLTGFLDEQGHARGRPVGVAIDRRGGLLVADDVGNTVWRVSGPVH